MTVLRIANAGTHAQRTHSAQTAATLTAAALELHAEGADVQSAPEESYL